MNAIAVCPGFHPAALTYGFVEQLQTVMPANDSLFVFPVERYQAYSGVDILRFLHEQLSRQAPDLWLRTPITFVGFSAGVVGAMGAAIALELMGGRVNALFALDGWGVPIAGRFPVHRLSHDYLTHGSSALLGAGLDSFYADPGVDHLELWRSPHTVQGQWISANATQVSQSITALNFLAYWLQQYQPSSNGF
uniref:Alpha/beta hydrolase n=1 Tax=Oscillatoriales cyanobacterium SpSt-402 TaxID=2282168 RepID=A0A832H3L2_9CYAN